MGRALALGDPHFSFAVWGVHYHSRGCCIATWAPNRRECRNRFLAMLYHDVCQMTKLDVVNIGGCLVLLQSWALYRMSFLALVSHQPYVFPVVNRWSIYPGIGRSYTVSIYRLMIEQHAREGMARRPQIDMSSYLQPSLEVYKPVVDIEAKPKPDPEPEPKPEPEPQPEVKSERSHSHSADSFYHLDLSGNDYFPSSSGGRYHYGFDIFG
ncbi:hypothetical protein PVK06_034481 [Gossypium arboreum]|uniref:Serine/threonine-protein phosphatase 7 long form-like protein n=1 Tax=Gossypium arboreum TaxID=29729 RepID=A0ABR0NH80_GOSAR|nr:hypothetical protein PVK06_034481 [Gossypium arboreum]